MKLVEVLDDPIEDSLYLVFELVQLGEVLSIPTESPLSEERAWSVFRDALLGLEYCKSHILCIRYTIVSKASEYYDDRKFFLKIFKIISITFYNINIVFFN